MLISQLGCCKHNPASRVGLTPSPTCHTGQGGSRKGMWPLRQRNGSHENVSPPRKTGGGFFIWSGGTYALGEFTFQLASPCRSQNWLNRRLEMTSFDKPKPQASVKLQHGKPSENPRYPRMSLERAKELGLTTEPVLIISPTPRPTSKDQSVGRSR